MGVDVYDNLILKKRNWISRWPKNKKTVMIISGGLDSVTTTARLIQEQNIKIFPLHIERGQSNLKAEIKSVDYFVELLRYRFPDHVAELKYIKLNIPPTEIKQNLAEYTKIHGHPLRDTMLQMVAAQYAVSLDNSKYKIRTIFCAVMPEDYFPHSNLASIRATNLAVCQNTNDWSWLVSSPNIDPFLTDKPVTKPDEIVWAAQNNIPIERTISCNSATEDTNLLNCGICSSCKRRKKAFKQAGVDDNTIYYSSK